MTTIVYDTKLLVSDSQSSIGNEIYEEDCQKLFPNVGPFAVIGIAGNYQDSMDVIEVISDYNKMDHIRGLDFEELDWQCAMLGVTHEGQVWHYSGKHSFELRSDMPFAIGSGAQYAMGAMYAGAGAELALEAASRFDIDTNNIKQIATLDYGRPEEPEVTKDPEEPTQH